MASNVQGRVIRSIVSKHNITTKAPSRTDQLVPSTSIVAKNQLVPQIQRLQHNSITVDNRDIYFYFKKVIGRECSCTVENNVAEGKCPICFKTGWVGGFDKFGTVTEILDVTRPLASTNLVCDYTQRPVTLTLRKDEVWGAAYFDIEMHENTGALDLLQIIDWRTEGANIQYYVANGTGWDILTEDTLTGKLKQLKIRIKIEFSRLSKTVSAPKLTCVRIRYNVREKLTLISDWPHPKNSRALSEYGIYNQWTTSEINMDNTIPIITPEDWCYRTDRNERWKIIESDRTDPLQLDIGWNLTARLIHDFEIYSQYPL